MTKLLVLIFALIVLDAQAANFIPSSFTANFKKTIKSLFGPKVTNGSLSYKYPGKIKFKTKRTTVISNGKKSMVDCNKKKKHISLSQFYSIHNSHLL